MVVESVRSFEGTVDAFAFLQRAQFGYVEAGKVVEVGLGVEAAMPSVRKPKV